MIPYGRQLIEDDDVAAVVDAVRSDWLTTGPRVAAFEADLAAATGVLHAVALSSGTSALHAIYAAYGIGPGDEVVVPAITFAATANAALYLGARPLFADIDATTGLVDPSSAAALVTERTKAIVGVDYSGLPADYNALREAIGGRDIALIADAAHSLGASDAGRPSGSLADASILSFHPVKHVTTGEGGAVVTGDADIRARVAAFRSHGIGGCPEDQVAEGPWYQGMRLLGYNYRITDIQCALGQSQLRKLERFVSRRRAIAARYDIALAGLPGIDLPGRRAGALSSWHLYVIRVREGAALRRRMFDRLRADGLGVQVHYLPVYRHPYYEQLGYPAGLCARAEAFYARAISIPLFPAMTDEDVERVISVVSIAADEILG